MVEQTCPPLREGRRHHWPARRYPSEISDLPRLAVNRIPTYTKGTNTTATDLFVGNFAQLLIGQRMQITLRPLDQLYAGTGQIGVVATWRGDVALARPSAFSVYRALRGA